MKVLEERWVYLFTLFCKDLLCSYFHFGSRTFICMFNIFVFVNSDRRLLWDKSGVHLHWLFVPSFLFQVTHVSSESHVLCVWFIGTGRSRATWMELRSRCYRWNCWSLHLSSLSMSCALDSVFLYLQHHLYHGTHHLIWIVDRVGNRVAGVSQPADVQILVVRGIAATHIGLGEMDNFLDEWSLVQGVEGYWDTTSAISTRLQFKPQSAPLQREPLGQGPRLVSQFQVSNLHPMSSSSFGC